MGLVGSRCREPFRRHTVGRTLPSFPPSLARTLRPADRTATIARHTAFLYVLWKRPRGIPLVDIATTRRLSHKFAIGSSSGSDSDGPNMSRSR